MNILLTGGAGYIGSHTAVVLSQAGHEVILLDNFCNSRKSILAQLEKIIGRFLPCIEGDIRDTVLLTKILQEYKINAVLHFAGLKSVSDSVKNPIEYYSNNVQGAISLLEAMKLTNVKTLVFSSSATVYGKPSYLPLDEQHPTKAINPYGRNKLFIEEMLNDLVVAEENWRVISLRYFNPVGAHESGLIGENPNGIPNNLVPYLAKVATGELPCLNIYGDNYDTHDGTGVRDYVHVMDLAEGHQAALDYTRKYSGYSVINLGTGRGVSVLDMLKTYELVSLRKIPHRILSRRPGDVASNYAGVEKAKHVLDWVAKRDIFDMCSSSWHWQKNRKKLN